MAERQRGAHTELSAPLRVLLVGHRFPPDGSGGYELHCADLRAHLTRAGHDVQVLTSLRGPLVDDDDPAVSRTLRWLQPAGRLDFFSAWRFERHNREQLDAMLDDFAPDVICWWRLGEMSLSLVEHAGRRDIPAVGYVGDGWLFDAVERDPWSPYRRAPLDFGAATWVFNSRWLRDATEAAGVRLAETLVLAPGVDRGFFTPGPERDWRGSLLYAGRLTPAKGVDVALRALARLPGARLQVIGDGSEGDRRALDSLAGRLGIAGRVTFGPALPRAELAGLYREADAVLFPVRWDEPFGLVPLEAMACGTPVVATGTGGSAEYLRDGGNALLVGTNEPAALAQAVVRLSDSPALRSRLRRGGLGTAAEHDGFARLRALEALLSAQVERTRWARSVEEAAG